MQEIWALVSVPGSQACRQWNLRGKEKMPTHSAVASPDCAPASPLPHPEGLRSAVTTTYRDTVLTSPSLQSGEPPTTKPVEGCDSSNFLTAFSEHSVFTQWVSLNLKVWIPTCRNVEKCFRHFYRPRNGWCLTSTVVKLGSDPRSW